MSTLKCTWLEKLVFVTLEQQENELQQKKNDLEMWKMKRLKLRNAKNETHEIDKCEKLTLENHQMREMKHTKLKIATLLLNLTKLSNKWINP